MLCLARGSEAQGALSQPGHSPEHPNTYYELHHRWLSEGDLASSALVEFDISDESQHVRFASKWMPELMKRLGETRPRKEMAAHASLRFRQEMAPLKIAAGQELPPNYLDPFGGCEDVRDPAVSF